MAHVLEFQQGNLTGKVDQGRRLYATPAWAKMRARKLRLTPNCEWCSARGPIAMHVDHKERVRDRPDLALDMTNLQTLCATCHNQAKQRHELEANSPVAGPIGADGFPTRAGHPWNQAGKVGPGSVGGGGRSKVRDHA